MQDDLFSPSSSAREGGRARARSLSPEDRSAIAKQAARARWDSANAKETPVRRATHGSTEHPLLIGDVAIPCYVLDDGSRVITLHGLTSSLGFATGGSMVAGLNRIELFAKGKLISPYITAELMDKLERPIRFVTTSGTAAYGFEATTLADICEAVLRARDAGVLMMQQLQIAHNCEILLRGFARVGIVALVDEVTGYQESRARDELNKILEAYISKEFLPWTRRFPDQFYKEIYRLYGWPFKEGSVKRPGIVGRLTNTLVYNRLPSGILDELRTRNPTVEGKSYRRYKHHQALTIDVGSPHLDKQISQVVVLLRIAKNWSEFKRLFSRAFPDGQEELDLGDD